MIDFLKIRINNRPIEHFLSNPLLDFTSEFSRKSGVITDFPMVSKLGSFKIVIRGNSFVEISGSIHKHYSSGENWNDFPFNKIYIGINSLCEVLKLTPNECIISNIEFGVNVETPVNPNKLLNNLICYKYTPFQAMKSKNGSLGFECYLKQYGVKIYSKKKQYGLVNNILRIEVKVIKMQKLPFIKSLQDLLILNNLKLLKIELLTVIANILIADKQLEIDLLSPKQKELYLKGINPEFWLKLHNICRKKCLYECKKFKQLVRSYESINYQDLLRQLIELKTNDLLNSNNSNELTNLPTILAVKTSKFSERSSNLEILPSIHDLN